MKSTLGIDTEKSALLGTATTLSSSRLERARHAAYTTAITRHIMYIRHALAPSQKNVAARRAAALSEPRLARIVLAAIVFSAMSVLVLLCSVSREPVLASTALDVQKCAIDNLRADLSFLDDAEPIEAWEFLERRDRLARALAKDGVDAFVVEPGFTFQYAVSLSPALSYLSVTSSVHH
jgi:hypothetical protein